GTLTSRPPISTGRQKCRCASCTEASCSLGSRSGKLGTCAPCAMSAIACLSWPRLQSDISTWSASQFVTRSGLVAKRGSVAHAGAGGRDTADEGRLLAEGTDRRFVEIVDLTGQHPGDAAGEEQGQIGRRIVCFRAGLPRRRNRDDRRGRVDPAKSVKAVFPGAKLTGPAFADDQGSRGDRRPRGGRIAGHDALAMVQVAGEGRPVGIGGDAGDPGADIGEEPAANRGRESGAYLRYFKIRQYRHAAKFQMRIARAVFAEPAPGCNAL